LKERLRRKDWRLVVVNPAKTTEQAYQAGEFKSVGLDGALKRLESSCGVHLTKESQDMLANFKKKRNKVEHFGIVDTSTAITGAAAETLGILLDFIAEELDPETLGAEDAALSEEIRARTGEFKAFVDHRMAEIDGDLDRAHSLTTCPSCLQDALVLGDIRPACLFCRNHGEGEEIARL